ncbi:MAG TPA: PIF1 family DEAD/DEAH box helicase [Candidatus Saccharimonadales bacterium]|nr:PIF1 family DEAD/DEAH box helicase [Candidatus Saccharimonadales bacterium]
MTQEQALAIMEAGKSVLLTGAAGAGKTYVLNKYIRRARKQGKSVAVTATTGLAATHLNGTTIHAWSGMGVHDTFHKRMASNLAKTRQELIKKADVLVIDEVSMLHDFRLDIVDDILQYVRGIKEPFGGMQVILCGDFFQLPPVNRQDGKQGGFVTSSRAWLQNVFTVCYLETQFRQKDDEAYTTILNGIRAGVLTRSQLQLLQDRSKVAMQPDVAYTRLLTVNIDVDSVNHEHLDELDEEVHEYEMETRGAKNYVDQLKRSCLAPEVLRLKKGAQVMCIKNAQDRKYVNGSLGTVIGFDSLTDYPIVALTNGREVTMKVETWELMDGDKKRASLFQLPLRLAWAITVHKSQGMTLDAARIDLSRAFVEGMGYVALSRVRSLDYLVLEGLNGMALRVSPLAKQIDAELREKSHQAVADNAAWITQWETEEAKRADEPEEDKKVIDKSDTSGQWQDKLEKMRQNYPNAYKAWAADDDEKLKKAFEDGVKLKELSTMFGRHPGSIHKRLEKHFGEGVEIKSM